MSSGNFSDSESDESNTSSIFKFPPVPRINPSMRKIRRNTREYDEFYPRSRKVQKKNNAYHEHIQSSESSFDASVQPCDLFKKRSSKIPSNFQREYSKSFRERRKNNDSSRKYSLKRVNSQPYYPHSSPKIYPGSLKQKKPSFCPAESTGPHRFRSRLASDNSQRYSRSPSPLHSRSVPNDVIYSQHRLRSSAQCERRESNRPG